MKKEFRGFTFIELLVSVSIFSIIILLLYSTFNTAIRAWRKFQGEGLLYQEARVALEKIGKDLRNTINFSGMRFIGEAHRFSVPTLINFSKGVQGGPCEIGMVSYFLDTENNSLRRTEERYPQWLNGAPAKPKEFAFLAKQLNCHYYYYDKESDAYLWKDSWEGEDKFPLGVKVELILTDTRSGGESSFRKSVLVPLGVEKSFP